MKTSLQRIGSLTLPLATALIGATMTFGQMPQQQQPGQQPSQQPSQPGQPPNPSNSPQPLTLDSTPPPVNAEEEAAIKTFRDASTQTPQDLAKKDQLAEQFVEKYPQSRYLPETYNWLVRSYYRRGEVDKMEAAADKQLALFPNDPQTLAIVGATLPRAMNSSTPDPQKRLAKSEQYCKKALDLLPTIPKPAGMADDTFQHLKNETASMAYSGLGMVAFRRGQFPDAISNLDSAVKTDPDQPDPVNFYVLGLANEKASHFQDAATAFTKCAAIQGGMQATCSQNAEEAKKLAATQPSAPK
jgi:tetratricopeptide (TPR) repeat protein